MKLLKKIVIFIASLALVIFLSIAAELIINELPRSSQGEAVRISFTVCVIGSILFQAVFSTTAALVFVKRKEMMKYFIICLTVALVINNFFYIPNLYKTWSRGW
jgi:hypothetical protein